MYSTLDILSMNNKKTVSDMTDAWELELRKEEIPKLKFPIKVIETGLDKIDLNFSDPTVNEPKVKKEVNKNQTAKIVDLPKKRNGNNKKDKSKLF
jgi:hypothetical protein